MPKEVLIVGAGTGGLMLANHLARHLASEITRANVAITLAGDCDEYLYQPGLLYVPFGQMHPQQLSRKITELIAPGVRYIHDRAVKIEPEQNQVTTESGRRLPYDYLVLATGSQINVAEVPGLAEGGHWFYDLDGALRLREALRTFSGGRVVVTMGLPHKCPVAPLEFTFMLDAWARECGMRDKLEIIYTFPINRAHSIQTVADWAAGEFERRSITLETFFNLESVDPGKREVTSLEGTTIAYDLLVAIPPHKGAALGADSGMAETGGWIPTHRHDLHVGDHTNIFAVGDATNLPISKAGSVAHFQAEVLAENLINLLQDSGAARRYNGKAFCFIEAGMEKATYLAFDYDNPPPVSPPTQSIHWFKQAYNRIHWLNLKGIV